MRTILLAGLICLASGCSGGGDDQAAKAKGKGGAGGNGPVEVGYVTLRPTSVPLVSELAARTAAFQMSEVRPQVAGLIRRRFFTEGALVRQGQTLYEVDPRLYRAAVDEAAANVQSARANAAATRVRADRLRPLAEMEAVAKQDYTDAAATARQAAASVAQTGAQLQTARVNLQFTRVPAPITGRIGRTLVTEGALVTANQTEPLAVIQRLDPIYVDIQQSSAELLALRRSLSRDGIVPASAAVRLKLEDGSDYGQVGTVEFAEVMVNASTGTVTLRARFPNPQGLLLPGMFVRAVFAQAINTRAWLVPQQAVSRTPQGDASIWVVGPDNVAQQRQVRADRAEGAYWVVTQGLNGGERIIVQGIGNLRPGARVRPVPARTPQSIRPAEKGDGGQAKGGSGTAKGG